MRLLGLIQSGPPDWQQVVNGESLEDRSTLTDPRAELSILTEVRRLPHACQLVKNEVDD